MYTGKLVFSQLMELFPWRRFKTCVEHYRGDHKVQSFSCRDQFLCMVFAQLTYRESLRDIEACLHAQRQKVYHMGIRGNIAKSTLADANENRDWRMYADFAQILIGWARRLYAHEDLGIDLDATLYALDSTTIDLCLSLFPWARFRRAKGAIKLHTLMNLRGSIPEFILISDGKLNDINVLDILIPVPGAYYIMDRGYLDFERLYAWHQAKAFFVTRAKSNFRFQRRYSHAVDKSTGVLCDQTIVLTVARSAQAYPQALRRIRYYDEQNDKQLVFLTNDFELPAPTIAQLYKTRWQIELFFKWIKQHLRIKSFYGTSENAVKTQIWIAISTYLLVAIAKKELRLEQSLYTILQMLSVSLFEKALIPEIFTTTDYKKLAACSPNQLTLFEL